MSAYSKGQYVTTVSRGSGSNVTRYGMTAYAADEELVVTSIMSSGRLRVRKSSGGYAFTIDPKNVAPVTRALGEAPEGAIEIDDPRIQWIFEDAARIANRQGFCSQYDKLAEAIGAPGRERKFTIEIPVPGGVTVKATVMATSMAAAKKAVRASLTGAGEQKALSA